MSELKQKLAQAEADAMQIKQTVAEAKEVYERVLELSKPGAQTPAADPPPAPSLAGVTESRVRDLQENVASERQAPLGDVKAKYAQYQASVVDDTTETELT